MIVRPTAGVHLMDRAALAQWLGRSTETIRRRCEPSACDVATRAVLYVAEEVAEWSAQTRRVAA